MRDLSFNRRSLDFERHCPVVSKKEARKAGLNKAEIETNPVGISGLHSTKKVLLFTAPNEPRFHWPCLCLPDQLGHRAADTK